MIEISRRQFFRAAGGVGVAVAASGCADMTPAVQTGQLGAGSGKPPDGPPTTHDGPGAIHDGPTMVACTTTPTDVGAASGYTLDKPVYFANGNFFVVKDGGGFFAVTAVCTHEGVTVCVGDTMMCTTTGTNFFCPRHGAMFAFDGTVTRGPAFLPLKHFAMCDMGNGHLGVITSMTVPAATRIAG